MAALAAKVLGYSVIAGSAGVKLPQLWKLARSRSSRGVSIAATACELAATSANCLYSFRRGFPISAYGEGVLLCAQTCCVAALTLVFAGRSARAVAFLALYAACVAVAVSPSVPFVLLAWAQAGTLPLVVAGKVAQGWRNYSDGGTGQLSLVTYAMLLFGSLARIFTSVQETGDPMMTLLYVVASAGNALVVGQIFYYWNSDGKKKK